MKAGGWLREKINFLFRLPTDCSVLYGRSAFFSRFLPRWLVRLLKAKVRPSWYAFSEPLRIRAGVTRILGQEFPPSEKKIEIDITLRCNLRCRFCDRFLDRYPSNEMMTVAQIEKFAKESVAAGRRWEEIHLIGGEPLLHPELERIIAVLQGYRKSFSPSTRIVVFTNGCDKAGIDALPADILTVDSHKDVAAPAHVPVTLAPMDFEEYGDAAFSNGCPVPEKCGIGLNMYGYYQCAAAGALDRILGLDIGRKRLPDAGDGLAELYERFCRYCGHFIRHPGLIRRGLDTGETVSASWKVILQEHESGRTALTRY